MNADVHAAVRAKDWLFYGQIGRELEQDGHTLDSSEYWAGYQPERRAGLSRRAVSPRLRRALCRSHVVQPQLSRPCAVRPGLRRRGQPHARPLPHAGVAGPGPRRVGDRRRRRGGVHGHRARAGRSGTRTTVAASGLYRAESDIDPRLGSAGVAFGFAPTSRLTTWTQVDGQFRDAGKTAFVLVNETSLEVYRGIWLDRDAAGARRRRRPVPDLLRFGVGTVFLPRTHFDVNINYYRDATARPTSPRRSSWRSCTCTCRCTSVRRDWSSLRVDRSGLSAVSRAADARRAHLPGHRRLRGRRRHQPLTFGSGGLTVDRTVPVGSCPTTSTAHTDWPSRPTGSRTS